MSRSNRCRPYKVGPNQGKKFPNRFRHPQGLIRRVWAEIYDVELNRFVMVPLTPGSTIVVPDEQPNLY